MTFPSLQACAWLTGCAGAAVLAWSVAVVPSASAARSGASSAATQPNAFAVVELFTSEGCSSCPPADIVLEKFAKEARDKNVALYPLAFHVNYWDRLGWKDPFSSAEATRRQRAYAEALKLPSVYTPQMVINGSAEFVGSDEARARQEISRAGSDPVVAALTLSHPKLEDGKLTVDFAMSRPVGGATLHVFAVVRRAVTKVPRGENEGKTLRHANVVVGDQAVSVGTNLTGQATVDVPAAFTPTAVIAIVQRDGDLKILGASAVDLPGK